MLTIGFAMAYNNFLWGRALLARLDGRRLASSWERIKGPIEHCWKTPLDAWRAAWWPNSAGAGAAVCEVVANCSAYGQLGQADHETFIGALLQPRIFANRAKKASPSPPAAAVASCTAQC